MSQNKKQNRCSEHQQQIVALCIDQNCKHQVKATCPLELYNDHLDHKFQNIAKVHSEWVLFQKDAKEVAQNVNKQVVVKFMDGIIEELLFKIKEHLFLVRKEFDIKMGIYYSSKPVDKIRSALTGIQKCLGQKFLDLRHQQIQAAKFFIEIYGMKKLVNDTLNQRQNFERQILIAFSKVKEEMFMDYPKFNALVKAKQYQYCQIIKSQKMEIDVLKQKVGDVSGGLGKVSENYKQVTYQLGRANNQIKNKQAIIAELTEKLRNISRKYNEQAEQAITKAREIKTKNIFGVHMSPNIFKTNDRLASTGDRQMDWPQFIDIGEAIGKIYVRLNRFDVGSWVLLGVMYLKMVQKNEFQFDNYKQIRHGCYLMDNNRWCYSDTNEQYNCKPIGFEFGQNDTIKVQIVEKVIKFSKVVYGWDEQVFDLPYEKKQGEKLMFCLAMKGDHTQVQIV